MKAINLTGKARATEVRYSRGVVCEIEFFTPGASLLHPLTRWLRDRVENGEVFYCLYRGAEGVFVGQARVAQLEAADPLAAPVIGMTFSLTPVGEPFLIGNYSDMYRLTRQGPLEGLSFVLSGTLDLLSRAEAVAALTEKGAQVSGAVTDQTDYLVAGAGAGSRLKRAETIGVPVIDEGELNVILSGGPLPPARFYFRPETAWVKPGYPTVLRINESYGQREAIFKKFNRLAGSKVPVEITDTYKIRKGRVVDVTVDTILQEIKITLER